MELKPGYKQTEVGVIPVDWEVTPLLSAVRIASGQVDPRVEPYRSMVLVAPDHIESGTGKLIERRTAEAQGAISGKYLFNSGDIIYSKIRPYLRKATLANFQGLCSADMYPLTPSNGVDSKFVFPILLGERFSRFAETVSVRSGIPKINREELSEFSLALPSLPEQQAIATALSDVDTLISSLDKLIAKKRDLKQAAMQQLLTGKQRLPGFSGEWKVKRIGSLLKFQVGFPFKSSHFNQKGDGIRLIKNRDLKSDDQTFHFSGKYDEAYIVRDGDVLVGMDGDFAPAIWTRGPALLNQRVGRILPQAGLNKVFASYFLIDPLKEIEIKTASTTVKHLSHGEVEAIEGPLPDVFEQTAIASVLSDMDTEIAALEQKRDKTRALKQGMMQELLTGRIRLV
ncbi:restriction endonuclease subunit S [Pandoraea sp. B-6]|uniref:restriction endonuclease subunit S n=1 Tax=Pandoraea sp. B-6 TaxID=1204340 RepID=UPI00035E215C|nr:restriction endonuclease subunit S [Pandoraea sp. B-6]